MLACVCGGFLESVTVIGLALLCGGGGYLAHLLDYKHRLKRRLQRLKGENHVSGCH